MAANIAGTHIAPKEEPIPSLESKTSCLTSDKVVDPNAAAMLEMGIQIIDMTAKAVEIVLSSPLGDGQGHGCVKSAQGLLFRSKYEFNAQSSFPDIVGKWPRIEQYDEDC